MVRYRTWWQLKKSICIFYSMKPRKVFVSLMHWWEHPTTDRPINGLAFQTLTDSCRTGYCARVDFDDGLRALFGWKKGVKIKGAHLNIAKYESKQRERERKRERERAREKNREICLSANSSWEPFERKGTLRVIAIPLASSLQPFGSSAIAVESRQSTGGAKTSTWTLLI